MNRRHCTPAVLLLALSACGPTVSLEIGVNERPVDVRYDQPQAAPPVVDALPPLPPARTTAPVRMANAPGFVAAPVPVGVTPPATPPMKAQPACATANGQLAPKEPAPTVVTKPPAEGVYRFRRSAVVAVGSARYELSPDFTRTISDVQRISPAPDVREQIRFRQRQEELGLVTTTTYRVDQPVVAPDGTVLAAGGIFIEQIVTERLFLTTVPGAARGAATGDPSAFGRETFTPTPAVQIADLPFAEQPAAPPRVSGGVDPLNGTAMNVRYRTIGRNRIDACGDVFDSWEVEIHPDSSFVNAGIRKYSFDGRISFAPQLGGIVVSEQLHFAGDEATIPYDMRSASTISATKPEPRR